MTHANLGRTLLERAAEMLAEHGTIERQPLMEGRNMYIVMAPLEKRAEKKGEGGAADDGAPPEAGQPPQGGETIGDRLAAKGQAPTATVEPEPAAEKPEPAEQG
jgi:translation initiation factor IF-3